ncbi:hypothetical protein PFISCL1PPCAC_4402, partial [Pristionchus fissidentatus]
LPTLDENRFAKDAMKAEQAPLFRLAYSLAFFVKELEGTKIGRNENEYVKMENEPSLPPPNSVLVNGPHGQIKLESADAHTLSQLIDPLVPSTFEMIPPDEIKAEIDEEEIETNEPVQRDEETPENVVLPRTVTIARPVHSTRIERSWLQQEMATMRNRFCNVRNARKIDKSASMNHKNRQKTTTKKEPPAEVEPAIPIDHLPCPFCSYAGPQLRIHIDSQHPKDWMKTALVCRFCDFQTHFRRNILEHQSKQFFCVLCSANVQSCAESVHMRAHAASTSYLMSCEHCNFRGDQAAMHEHSMKVACGVCGEWSPQCMDVDEHMMDRHTDFWLSNGSRCEVPGCDYRTFDTNLMTEHSQTFHKMYLISPDKLRLKSPRPCPFCATVISDFAHFNEHMESYHRDKIASRERILICAQCQYSCARSYQMIMHFAKRRGGCTHGIVFAHIKNSESKTGEGDGDSSIAAKKPKI